MAFVEDLSKVRQLSGKQTSNFNSLLSLLVISSGIFGMCLCAVQFSQRSNGNNSDVLPEELWGRYNKGCKESR